MAFYIRNGSTNSTLCDSAGRIGYDPNGSSSQNVTFEGGDGVNLFNGNTIRSSQVTPSVSSTGLYVRSGLVLEDIIEGTSGASETETVISIPFNKGNHYPGYHKIVFTQYGENESVVSPMPRFRVTKLNDDSPIELGYSSFGSSVRSDSLGTRSWYNGTPSATSRANYDGPDGTYGYWFDPSNFEPFNSGAVPFAFEMDVFNALTSGQNRPCTIQTRVGFTDSTLTRQFSQFNSVVYHPAYFGSVYFPLRSIEFYEGETASSSPQFSWRAYVYTPWMGWDD